MTGAAFEARAKALTARLLGGPWVFSAIAAIFVVILGAASLPWPRNRFIAFLDTGALGIVVARDTTLRVGIEGAAGSGVGIEQAEVVPATLPPPSPLAAGSMFSGRLIGGTIGLPVLRLGPGAEVTLLVDALDRLEIRLRGDATADLVLAGAVRAQDVTGRETELRFDAPEILTLRPRSSAFPLRLLLVAPTQTSPVTIEGIYVNQLTLTRDRQADSPGAPFRAEVKSGKVRLVDVHRERDLRAREPLRFEHLDAYLAIAEIGARSIHADFVGHARRIVLGPQGYADDITPSVLEYLVNQEILKLLWGAGAMLLAGLWGTWRWARDARSGG